MSTSTIPGVDQITRHATRLPGDTVGALPVRRRITISAPAPATRLAYRHAEVNSHGSWATSHCTLEAESARRRCCADPQGTRTSGEMGTYSTRTGEIPENTVVGRLWHDAGPKVRSMVGGSFQPIADLGLRVRGVIYGGRGGQGPM